MISGATRGKGGRALSAHLLKAEKGQEVTVIPPRGIISRGDLHAQLRELVAGARVSATEKAVYHVHVDPPEDALNCQAVLAAWWRAFEGEFKLSGQPYVGAQHVKRGRKHEHRVYSLVRPDGRLVDMSHDYARRTKLNLIVAHDRGLSATRSPFARAAVAALDRDGRMDVASWAEASGLTEDAAPIAPVTPVERLIEARTSISLSDLRRKALTAWRASSDGPGFEVALIKAGLTLREGTAGAVLVDRSGTAHSLARVIGSASRINDGDRIPAKDVKARIAGLTLTPSGDDHERRDARRNQSSEANAGYAVGQPSHAGGGGGNGPGDVTRGCAGGRGSSSRCTDREHLTSAIRGFRDASPVRRRITRSRLSRLMRGDHRRSVADVEDATATLKQLSGDLRQPRIWTGATDIWGLPII